MTFLNDGTDRKISAYNFWVRAGELVIGTAEEPYTAKANIHLLGTNEDEYFAFSNSIETGNKNLVITGDATMVGAQRSLRSRLRTPVFVGDTTMTVDAGLDWV